MLRSISGGRNDPDIVSSRHIFRFPGTAPSVEYLKAAMIGAVHIGGLVDVQQYARAVQALG